MGAVEKALVLVLVFAVLFLLTARFRERRDVGAPPSLAVRDLPPPVAASSDHALAADHGSDTVRGLPGRDGELARAGEPGRGRPTGPAAGVTRRFPAYGTLGRFTWRLCAVVLAGEAIVIFFWALVARALAAATGSGRADAYLWVGSAVAVLSLLSAALMRRPFGVTLGWVVQLAALLGGVVVRSMLVVGILFLAIWLACLAKGHDIDQVAPGASG